MAAGSKYVRFPLGDGSVVVEVEAPTGARQVSAGTAVAKATETLETSLEKAAKIILAARDQLRQVIDDAEQIELEFGIKFSGELGVILAKSSVEANLKVTVTWKR